MEVGGLSFSVDLRACDLVGVDVGRERPSFEDVVAGDSQDARFDVDFFHEVLKDEQFVLSRQFRKLLGHY